MLTLDLPKRKHPRLDDYDYAQNGAYFVTFCTAQKRHILSHIAVGRGAYTPPQVQLTKYGRIVEKYIGNIHDVCPDITVDCYAIMPNHVHLLLRYADSEPCSGGVRAPRPTVMTVVRSLKTMVTKEIGHTIWQKSFYDHVIRNEADYLAIWQYVDGNPQTWTADEFYSL